jgi:hypothetical protein
MTMIATKPVLTRDDLLARPDGDHFELVDGHLVGRDFDCLAGCVAFLTHVLIVNYCCEEPFFRSFGLDHGYRCFPEDPGRVRRVDASVIGLDRLAAGPVSGNLIGIAPDLAIAVVKAGDLASEIESRVKDFLDAGTRLVWVVNPMVRIARVHRADRSGVVLFEDDELDGEDVMPGFRCRLGDLFPPAQQPSR